MGGGGGGGGCRLKYLNSAVQMQHASVIPPYSTSVHQFHGHPKTKSKPAHHVRDGGHNLSEDHLGLALGQLPLAGDLGEELPSAGILHDDVQLGQGLHHLIKADDVGVVESLHAGDLPRQQALGLLVQLRLVQDFDGHFLCKNAGQGVGDWVN